MNTNETILNEQNEVNPVTYLLKSEFIHDLKVCLGEKHSFSTLSPIISQLEAKKEYSKEEIEELINFIAKFPYNHVEHLLLNINNYISQKMN